VVGESGGTGGGVASRPSQVCVVTTRLPRPAAPVPWGGGPGPTDVTIVLPAASGAVQATSAAVRAVARRAGAHGRSGSDGATDVDEFPAAGGSAAQVLRGADGGGASIQPDDGIRAMLSTWAGSGGGLGGSGGGGGDGGARGGGSDSPSVGDAGPGVDLARMWASEDTGGTGMLPTRALAPLLRRLGSPAWRHPWQL